ncbi:hypothetical protein BDQ17DRAFT_683862 [Cyathus striatus]|nr:hypothetical protein BDQ17DRAFT_683862 [Cyathus striatus]
MMHMTGSFSMNDVRLEKLHDLSLQFSPVVTEFPKLIDFSCTYPDFQSATALEEIKLVKAAYLPVSSDLFPWSKIRKLTLDYCTLVREQEAITAFRALSSLEELTWRNISCAYFSRAHSQRVITLLSLHTLTLENWDRDPIWHMIRMPSLTTIRFIRDSIAFLRQLVSMVQLSASNIKTVGLMYCSASFISNVVKEFSNAEELSVTYSVGETSKFLSRLIWAPNPRSYIDVENVLPSLQKLKLRNFSYEDACFMRSLKDVMRSRSVAFTAEDDPTDLPRATLPLLVVECRVEALGVEDECFTLYLKNLAEELGIEADIEVERISVHARL